MFDWKFGPNFLLDETGGTGGDGTGGDAAAAAAAAAGTQEHPVSAPWADKQGVWTLGEGDKAQPWWTTLPDEKAREHIAAKAYANPTELALANYNLTRMQTGDPNVLVLPGKDATPEQVNDFYTKLGRPPNADSYEFKFGEGVKASDDMVKFGKDFFFELGVPADKAQAGVDKWNNFVAAQNQAALDQQTAENNAALDALKTSWGAELDANKADGQRAMQALGLSAEAVNAIEASIGSAPIVELLATLGKKTREGGLVAGSLTYDANNPETMSKEQAQTRINELQADPTFTAAYTDKTHAQHAEKVQLMQRLYAKI